MERVGATLTCTELGGDVAKKKYDPLWEIVDEKVALQGQEADVDGHCPYCNVTVHLGSRATTLERVSCGLCGGVSEVKAGAGGVYLEPVSPPSAG
jgi:hypothetical protein